MEVGQERFFTNEGQGVGEMGLEKIQNGPVRIETVEFRGRREERASERLVLHVRYVSPTWGREVQEASVHLTLLGRAMSMKVCLGQMCRWLGSSRKVESPPVSFDGPAGILSSRYSCGIYSC